MEGINIDFQGLASLEIQDKSMGLVILPEWSENIVSLFDKRHRRE